MNTGGGALGWRLSLKCILVYGASWMAGLLLYVWLGSTFGYALGEMLENVDPAQISAMQPFLILAVSIFFGGAVGATIGRVQSIFLYRYVGAGGWVLASALGGALSMLLDYTLSDLFVSLRMTALGDWEARLLVSRTAFSAFQQGSVGLLQWLVLRRRVAWAWQWIPACWVSGAIGGGVGFGVESSLLRNFGVPFEAGIFVPAVIGGLIGGPVLAWLFRHPRPSPLQGLVPASSEG